MDANTVRCTGVSCSYGLWCFAGGDKHCHEQLWSSQQAGRVLLESECYTNQVDAANPLLEAVVVSILSQRLGGGSDQTEGSTCTDHQQIWTRVWSHARERWIFSQQVDAWSVPPGRSPELETSPMSLWWTCTRRWPKYFIW